jgi:hypothetical protein
MAFAMTLESFASTGEEGMVVAAAATFVSCGVCSAFLHPKANRTTQIEMVRDFIGFICTNVKQE